MTSMIKLTTTKNTSIMCNVDSIMRIIEKEQDGVPCSMVIFSGIDTNNEGKLTSPQFWFKETPAEIWELIEETNMK